MAKNTVSNAKTLIVFNCLTNNLITDNSLHIGGVEFVGWGHLEAGACGLVDLVAGLG